jgi:hypothetical protein
VTKVTVTSAGVLQIAVRTGAPGTLTALARAGGKNYATATAAARAGALTLTLNPTAAGRRAARKHRQITITVTLTLTAGGGSVTRTISKTLPGA